MRAGYGSAYQQYRDAGWVALPLPRGQKEYPDKGFTGDTPGRHDPTAADYRKWARDRADGNVAIVMPGTVCGIDVDCYAGGGETLDGLEKQYGPLPVTWESTSRAELDWSGIKLFRVPDGTRLKSKIDPGIQICQWFHRYVVCEPSIHPEGRRYQWWMGTGRADIPKVSELPDLPKAWLLGLADRPKAAGDGTPYDGDLDDWLSALPDVADGFIPASVRKLVRDTERKFGDGSCRHDTMVSATGKLVQLGAQGKPVYGALHELADLFCAAVYDDRHGDEEYEYWSAVALAVKKWGGRKPRKRCPGVSDDDLRAAAARITGRSS